MKKQPITLGCMVTPIGNVYEVIEDKGETVRLKDEDGSVFAQFKTKLVRVL
jgi:hypothetical protein